MSGPIRNFAVAVGRFTAAGQTALYTVPANYAFIIKSAGIYNASSLTATGFVFLYDPVSAAQLNLFVLNVTTAQTVILSTWAVLNAGHVIYLNSPQFPLHYWISGAVLPYSPTASGLAQFEPQPSDVTAPNEPDPAPLVDPMPPTIYLPDNGALYVTH